MGVNELSRERLDKILALQCVVSRKDAGALIRRGVVSVNGEAVKKSDFKVDTLNDEIKVNGEILNFKEHLYIMMNKPDGVLSAARDPKAKTVIDLLPENLFRRGLFPAGRLDKDTEGLLIITDDGDFAHRMLSPKKHIYKYYEAVLENPISQTDIEEFKNGVVLNDMTCLPAELVILKEGNNPIVKVKIREGKFHQVKRMFLARNNKVLKLKRVKIGGLNLDESLLPGEARELKEIEVNSIFN
jgi:16S rRNA pseudouridine516 synthase